MRRRLIVVSLLTAVALLAAGQKKMPKPSWPNFFSKEQDVEMGREYAQQIEQQMTVVQNKELTDYVNRIGERLVKQGGLDNYPYFFKVVQEPSINAFALPGGPMFVHTGLLKAADNEAQVAGVLAHELAHVVLRHGTHQASKAQLIQIPAMLAGAVAGGTLTGQLAQLGIGLGANSLLLKFSRGAESDADLLGSYTMAKAGYNPIELARFFEKLEAQTGKAGNSKLSQFMSDHPNPGNRVQAIEGQLPYMARGPYDAHVGDLKKMQAIVDGLPAAPKKPAKGQGTQAQGGTPAQLPNAQKPAEVPISSTTKSTQTSGMSISYPSNWQETSDQGSLTVAPAEGRVQSFIGYGVMVNIAQAPSGQKVNLEQDTQKLLQGMAQQNSGMKVVEQAQQVTIGGSKALVTKLASDSPYAGTKETDVVVTIDRGTALYYLIFVAPEPDYAKLEPVFQQMTRSIRFQ
ncbi:M48 family metalloprotease [uncultured Paludibaculum sp.]|uniref:M48 family metallopeptidase n=1 Tax=uncultured Paludibaculum sp. TaxID=1765020 RepID=UPI002AAB6666|nr:M48 family metalloprotease [uncultured Paludibaculum sp.]